MNSGEIEILSTLHLTAILSSKTKRKCGENSTRTSMSSPMVELKLERGDKMWFRVVVGLPYQGLDPSMDCNHVGNRELEAMFGGKKPNREYVYTNARLQKVKIRVEELYLPMYQVDRLPVDCCIPESFTRAIQSEVCRGFPMNLARFSEERWKRKKSVHEDESIQYYIQPGSQTRDKFILDRL
jgi:hypothetical protein